MRQVIRAHPVVKSARLLWSGALLISFLGLGVARGFAGVTTVLLEDFEGGGTHSAAAVTTANSSAGGNSNSTVANITDGGSKRLKLTDSDGGWNGCVVTFTNAITAAGNYLVTADVKVDNSSTAIGSFGMAARLGGASTTMVTDPHAGYVMDLHDNSTTASGFGYRTMGAGVLASGGSYPQSLTLYFSTNPSGNSYSAPATDGTFRYEHRTNTDTWSAGSSDAVYLDNIRLIGPGNVGEDRHYWISAGNNYNNLAQVQEYLDIAKNNHFNCVDILARFRTDAYYVPNRDFNGNNPEPFGTLVGGGTPSSTNDPLQYCIDHCHEMGLKAYISFSCFLATPNDTYPSILPSGSATYIYNSGSPRLQTSADSGEGVWADVGRADVRAHCINVMKDIVRNYDLDGVIFDRIRYEHNDYGYNPQAILDLGYTAGSTPAPTDATFLDRRRNAVVTYLHDAYEAATDLKPWMVVGTVPIIYFTSFNDTYNDVLQFWPKWCSWPTRNRNISFGAEDCIQPQCYRSGSTYGPYNSVYLDLGRYGDIPSFSRDYGFMPGANVNFCPLFYHPSTGDSAQSLLNAQNVCDARQKECNGSGIYSADTVRTDIHLIRNNTTSPCGFDAFASAPANADFLMKAGYDNTPPNSITGLTATPNGSLGVTLNWTAPVSAADGQTASRYLIYRGTLAGVKQYYSTLRNKAATVTSPTYFDSVPASGNYYYSVVAVDGYNNRAPAVEIGPVSVTGTAASSTPSAPGTLKAVAMGNVVYFTWSDLSSIESSFEVTRDSVSIATLSENVCAYTDNNVAAGSHTYAVRAKDSFGNSSYVSATAVTAANTVSAPSSLVASDGGGVAQLTWTDNSTNESGMEILRSSVSGGPYTQAGTISPGSASYSDTPPTLGTWYYVVRAFNGSGISLYSNQASVTVTSPLPPSAPSGLTAMVSGASIILNWTDNSTNETGFEVRRATISGGSYVTVNSTNPNVTTFTDSPGAAGIYYYIVRAVNNAGNSSNSNEVNASISLPNAPSGLTATVSGSSAILNWSDNSTNESAFELYRGTTSGGPYSLIATTAANGTVSTDTVSTPGTYYYVVRAINGLGASGYSNQATAVIVSVPDLIIESRQPGGAITASTSYQEFLNPSGTWANTTAKSAAAGCTGTGGRWTGTGSVGSYAVFKPNFSSTGYYNVYVTLPNATSGPNVSSPGASVLITHDGTDITATVDLTRFNTALLDKWYLIAGNVKFAAGSGQTVRITNNNASSADTGFRFDMDAVKFEFAASAPVSIARFVVE